MIWGGWDLKDLLVPTPLSWTGTTSTRPGCSRWDSEADLWNLTDAYG